MNKKSLAFTLAEVLITLGIIGVVSAITIPILMNNTQNEQFHTALKKEYSTLTNATERILTENGGYLWDDSSAGSTQRHQNMRDEYAKFLHVARLDTTANIFNYNLTSYDKRNGIIDIPSGVGVDQSLSWISTFIPATGSALVLNDGSILSFVSNQNCSNTGSGWGESQSPVTHYYCGYIMVDVNGIKPPNRIGVDFYSLWVVKDTQNGIKLIPATNLSNTIQPDCGYASGSGSWWGSGFGCARYVLQNQTLPTTAQSP